MLKWSSVYRKKIHLILNSALIYDRSLCSSSFFSENETYMSYFSICVYKVIFLKMYNSVFLRDLKFANNSEKAVAPHSLLLPGKSHGRRSLVGCSPWGRKELDTTEWLYFHFSVSCIGEGNGNPLQCSYLENPRDGGTWWAAVSGVAQSRTRLKRLSSSSRGTNIWLLPGFL